MASGDSQPNEDHGTPLSPKLEQMEDRLPDDSDMDDEIASTTPLKEAVKEV